MIGMLNNKQWIYEDGTRTLTLDGQVIRSARAQRYAPGRGGE